MKRTSSMLYWDIQFDKCKVCSKLNVCIEVWENIIKTQIITKLETFIVDYKHRPFSLLEKFYVTITILENY